MRRTLLAIVVGLLVGVPPARANDELLVFAAASLTDALRELATSFEQTGRERVAFSFGASSDLARQIEAGAPADVFFSADVPRMEALEQAGLIDRRERRNVLSNVLVVVVPLAAPITITGPADLTTLRTLALANPESVPAGVYARRYLESRGLWDRLANKVVPTGDVRAAVAAVAAERADAGIVYATDAALSKTVTVAFRVPRADGPPIVYPLAPLARAPHAGARAFVRFLVSAEAARVYERYGFIVLPAGSS